MDPQTVLRFLKSIGGWPGKVVVIACEPQEVEDMGLHLTEKVGAAVDRACDLTMQTVADLHAEAAAETG